jgi:hypothetical protein
MFYLFFHPLCSWKRIFREPISLLCIFWFLSTAHWFAQFLISLAWEHNHFKGLIFFYCSPSSYWFNQALPFPLLYINAIFLSLSHSSAMKMKAANFSKMSAKIWQIMLHHIPEDRKLHSNSSENFKSHIIFCSMKKQVREIVSEHIYYYY